MIYLLLMIFICNEVYYLLNKDRLNTNFKNIDIQSIKNIDIIYYLTKVFYWGWITLNMFYSDTSLRPYFISLFILGLLKFPIYHINKKAYIIFDMILPFISVVILTLMGIN